MGYDILTDDLYEENSEKPKPKKHRGEKKMSGKKIELSINPFYIHLSIIIVVLLILFLFFMGDFSFDLGEEDKKGHVSIVGDLSSLYKNYSGNIELFASEFILETRTGKFTEGGKDFDIENFNGSISYENKSVVFEGIADKIIFGNSNLNLQGENFSLHATKKTRVTLYFDSLNLGFKEGNIKLDSSLNYDFIDSNINISGMNTTITYDGSFTFVGKPDYLVLNAPKDYLQIKFER